jgi:pilus assembly protein FimV
MQGSHMQGFARRALGAAVTLAFAVGAWSLPAAADAAGLGRLSVRSELGQPLDADVEVPSVTKDEAASLQVRLASQAAFRQANLEFNPVLTQLRFDLEARPDGGFVVHVRSAEPVNEPYLDLLLELSWGSGRVLREYTVLLDPPGMKAGPQVIAPAAVPVPAAAPEPAPGETPPEPQVAVKRPQPAAPAPAVAGGSAAAEPQAKEGSKPASGAASAASPSAAAEPKAATDKAPASKPEPKPAPTTVRVKSGDTLGHIASQGKPAGVSLDQMLIAYLQANPKSFVDGNINRLRAGGELAVPSAEQAQSLEAAEARRQVIAQSQDFAAYRSRLAQSAAPVPATEAAPAAPAAQGKVSARVDDKAAPRSGDQLKIARSDATPGAALSKKDEEVARQRALKEQQDRAAALAKANDDLRKAAELQARKAAEAEKLARETQARKEADAKAAEAKAAEARRVELAKAAEAEKAAREVQARKEADAKAAQDKAAQDKAAQDKAAQDKAAQEKSAKAPAAPAPEAKKPAAPAPVKPAETGGLLDTLMSPMVLGGLGAVLAGLVGLNVLRRRRASGGARSEGDPMMANSLFGAAGGQSVDTSATSTFNSSFIPAASQLDSNEVDPVAEADVYIAYGREEQAEDILKEALRVQPDRHPVRVKLLEIFARRGDTASFNAVAQELHDRTGGQGEDWERAAKMGRGLDPANALYAGAGLAEDSIAGADATQPPQSTAARSPATLPSHTLPQDTMAPVTGTPASEQPFSPSEAGFDSQGLPETALPRSEDTAAFHAELPTEPAALAPAEPGGATAPTIDFGSLDFDLGPSKLNLEVPTELPMAESFGRGDGLDDERRSDPATIPSLDLVFPPTEPATIPATIPANLRQAPATVSGMVPIPDIDLDLPSMRSSAPPRPIESTPPASALDQALSRPTLLGAVGSLPDGDAGRLGPSTDQATVPLIDFDLSGADNSLTGRRTETQVGSPLASQMATKLDLARGYIDLGVKDGARELLEEVMKDGTREQRQQAVELIKLVEA